MYQLTKLDQPEEPMEGKVSNPEKTTKISITNAKTRVKKMEVLILIVEALTICMKNCVHTTDVENKYL